MKIDGPELWRRMCIEAEVTPSLAAVMEQLSIGSFDGTECELVLHDPAKEFGARSKLEAMSRLAKQLTGSPVRFSLAVKTDTAAPQDESISRHAAANHPLVKQAQELFDARIVSIEPDTGD
ncbi:MAG: hypothetical protein ACIAQF_13375 [Phycisphaerales bacterium JB065]